MNGVVERLIGRYMRGASDIEVGETLGIVLAQLVLRYGEEETRKIVDIGLNKMRQNLANQGIEMQS